MIDHHANNQGFHVVKLKQRQFIINTDTNGLMKGSEVTESSVDQSNNYSSDHENDNSNLIEYSNRGGRGGDSCLLVMIKTPQYWLFETDEQVKQISCGDATVLVGKSGRTLYVWKHYGEDFKLHKIIFDEEIDVVGFRRFLVVKTRGGEIYMSELATDTISDLKKATNLPFNTEEEKVVDISCGSTHNLLLTDKGKVYGYGQNYGQLGVNTSNYSDSWAVSNIAHIPDKIKRVYCTYNTSFLLTENGHLYAAGDRSYGANGLIEATDSFLWTRVPKLDHEIVTDVRPGLFFVAVLTQSRKIYVFGYFNFKQFGLSPNFTYDVNRGPKIMDSFNDINNIQDIVCGGYNSVILTRDNSLFIGGDTSLVNSDGRFTEFKWNEILPNFDKSTSVVKVGLTSDRLIMSIHQNNISKYFNFRNAWKIADVFFPNF